MRICILRRQYDVFISRRSYVTIRLGYQDLVRIESYTFGYANSYENLTLTRYRRSYNTTIGGNTYARHGYTYQGLIRVTIRRRADVIRANLGRRYLYVDT